MQRSTLPLVLSRAVIAVFLFATAATGQSKSADQGATPFKDEVSKLRATMPSTEELSELLAKADQKVSNFEKAVGAAKPYLDKIDPKYAANYLDGASTAHYLIQATNKNGPSAYRLVGLVATLDDLSLDAANGTVFLLGSNEDQVIHGKPSDMAARGALIALEVAGTACNDISELLMHATLRFVNVEEQLLEMLLPKDN